MGNLYPESIYKLFLVNAPFAFRAMWKMITPFVDEATLKKIQICGAGDNTTRNLFAKNGVTADQYPDFLGGGHAGRDLIDFVNDCREEGVRRKKEQEAKAKAEVVE